MNVRGHRLRNARRTQRYHGRAVQTVFPLSSTFHLRYWQRAERFLWRAEESVGWTPPGCISIFARRVPLCPRRQACVDYINRLCCHLVEVSPVGDRGKGWPKTFIPKAPSLWGHIALVSSLPRLDSFLPDSMCSLLPNLLEEYEPVWTAPLTPPSTFSRWDYCI